MPLFHFGYSILFTDDDDPNETKIFNAVSKKNLRELQVDLSRDVIIREINKCLEKDETTDKFINNFSFIPEKIKLGTMTPTRDSNGTLYMDILDSINKGIKQLHEYRSIATLMTSLFNNENPGANPKSCYKRILNESVNRHILETLYKPSQ